MNILNVIAAVAVTVFAPAPAQEPAPKAKVYQDFDKVVCKTIRLTGSRLSNGRACYTKRDWRRMAGSSEQAHKDMIEGNMVPPRGE